jgi:hypothetical protein
MSKAILGGHQDEQWIGLRGNPQETMGFATHSGKFPEIVRSFLGDLPKVKRTVANCGTSYYGYDFQYSMRPKGIATSWYVPISIFMCIYIYIYLFIYICTYDVYGDNRSYLSRARPFSDA